MKSYKEFILQEDYLEEKRGIRLPGVRLPGVRRPPAGRPPTGGGKPQGGGLGGFLSNLGIGALGAFGGKLVWDGAKWVVDQTRSTMKQPIGQERSGVSAGKDQPGLPRVS